MFRATVAQRLLSLSRRQKRLLAITADTVICSWCAWGALYLRLEEWTNLASEQGLTVLISIGIAIPVFIRCGLYRTIFRHAGWPAMVAVTQACLIYGLGYATVFTFIGIPGVPRTVGLIQPLLVFVMIAISRAVAHYLLGGRYRRIIMEDGAPRVLIFGAGASGRQLASALRESGTMHVVGFLDDDASLQGAWVLGAPVFDPTQLPEIAERHETTEVLLAIPSAPRQRRKEIVDLLNQSNLRVRTLPGLADIASGQFLVSDIRSLEIEDLLGRDLVEPSEGLLRAKIAGKIVMVTGGGGSIGGELCRQIMDLQPRALLILESSEYALYSIRRELENQQAARLGEHVAVIPLLASVRDGPRIQSILAAWKPQTIYHAAAYKHVPLVEHNCLEGLKNNVLGTLVLVRAAIAAKVTDLVLISTDKAVRPTNVMGASKRLAELILQAYADRGSGTSLSMVRFGNVLGSSGSVVPLFRDQIRAGGPVTVTHKDVTRFFMTIREAAQLVIQAGSMARGGEVFVLDMGEAVRIHDLAVSMIELSGLRVRNDEYPDGDIEIREIGLRPGEKLYEELLIGDDPMPTAHSRIMHARERFIALEELVPALARLEGALETGDVERALETLRRLVPEYSPDAKIVDWVHTQAFEFAGTATVHEFPRSSRDTRV